MTGRVVEIPVAPIAADAARVGGRGLSADLEQAVFLDRPIRSGKRDSRPSRYRTGLQNETPSVLPIRLIASARQLQASLRLARPLAAANRREP